VPESLETWRRADGRVAVRNRLLVLPSVVCAARVAQYVAAEVGGVAIAHQHGCGQVGDDGVRTGQAFEGIACGPNVGAVLVVSLGCETLAGRGLADRIAARGQRTEFVGIQEVGGSDRARDAGRELGAALAAELAQARRGHAAVGELTVGVEAARPGPLARAFVARALSAGAGVVVGEAFVAGDGGTADADVVPAFSGGPPAPGRATVLVGAGHGAQQHAALAAHGAHVIVSLPDPMQPPAGFATCPVVAVGTASRVHAAVADEFDLAEDVGVEALWRFVLEVAGGAPTASETAGEAPFALPRLTRTM
jgi:altronate dehydratase